MRTNCLALYVENYSLFEYMNHNQQFKRLKINSKSLKVKPLKKKKMTILHDEMMGDVDFFRVMLFTPTGGGKSTAIACILRNTIFMPIKRKIPDLIIVSTTTNEDPVMMDIIRRYEKAINIHIFERYDTNVHKDILKIIKEGMEFDHSEDDESNEIYSKFILLMDDVNADALIFVHALYGLIKCCRHKKLSVILSVQHFIETPLPIRTQMSHFILFEGCSDTFLKDFYDMNVKSKMLSFDTFKAIYEDATEPDKPGQKSYNFFFFNKPDKTIRRNFDEPYRIKNY